MSGAAIAHTLIRDCMSEFLITLAPYDTLSKALELMTTNHIRRLPVVNHDELIGIVTWTDVLELKQPDPGHRQTVDEFATHLEAISVSTVMTKNPITVYRSDTVGHAAELMLENKIGGLPVIDANGKLEGLVTESNIFRLIAKRWREDNELFSGAKAPL